ncbi:hypothetical protein LC087_17775 [Bacillus carboniphilus]|uniref:Uncharacterized protein n=1 Tax=Bacillus carboniphilus TaxID=86663 RepID=A0ABY9JSZ1_9BACI|nr:hypothetical protein [Bacillus carboniphilus]WLR42516.1 hypothetical protein LC087_17775 [Bacillus carboniphilus]
MFVRLFVDANDEKSALDVFNMVIGNLNSIVISYKIEEIKPYWKIDNVLIIEFSLDLSEIITIDKLTEELKGISDKWTAFGEPVEELLASDTTEGCEFLLKGVRMINIYL